MRKKLSWIEAADILGMSYRHLQRVREAYRRRGFDGLYDARVGKTSPPEGTVVVVEEVLRLSQESENRRVRACDGAKYAYGRS
jgi:hypothetical protein